MSRTIRITCVAANHCLQARHTRKITKATHDAWDFPDSKARETRTQTIEAPATPAQGSSSTWGPQESHDEAACPRTHSAEAAAVPPATSTA